MNTNDSDAKVDSSSPSSSKRKRELADGNDTRKLKCIENSKKKKKIVAVIAIAATTDVPVKDPTFQKDNPSTDAEAASAALATTDVSLKGPTFVLDHRSTDGSVLSKAAKIVDKEDTPEEQNDPVDLAFLGFLKDDTINKNGFVFRKLAKYRAANLSFKIANVKTVTDHYNNLNNQVYPRTFDTDSRKALSKLSPQSPTKHSAEMKSIFFEDDQLNETLANDFKNEYIIPTVIKFDLGLSDEQCSTDKRLQFAFTAKSETHERVCKLLREQKLYDPDKENISEVSLIIGGTANQDPHGDHPRVYSFFGRKNQVSHEINRKEYNEAMKSPVAHSSILSGFDKSFKLAIPDCYLEQGSTCRNRNMIKAKCSSDEFKQLDSTEFVCLNNNGVKFDMVTIEVPSEGCQFVGDFMHSGADNVTGCLTENEEKAFNDLFAKASSIVKRDQEKKDYSDLFNCMKSANYLAKITRFFCKTIPIDYKNLVVPYHNIMPLSVNACQYDENYAHADAKQDIKCVNQNEKLLRASTLTARSKHATEGAKKDQQKYPPKGTKKKQTKDQTKAPSAKRNQQKDAKDSPTIKIEKEQTNDQTYSPSSKKNQQKASSSPAKQRSPKSPDSTMPVPKRFCPYVDNDKTLLVMRNMNEFQSIEFAIGRGRNIDNKLYDNRKNCMLRNTTERGDAAKNLIEKDGIPLILTGSGKSKNILAKENAFSLYFDLDTYTESFKNGDCFDDILKDLSKRIKFAAVGNQKCRVVPVDVVDEVDEVQKVSILKKNKWTVDLGFDEWTEVGHKSNGQIPLVEWMKIKQDKETKELSVSASRRFVAGEVIGLFWGKRLDIDIRPSTFAFENEHGIYDAKRGLIADGSPVYNMAVHIMRVSFDEKEFNARLSNDFLLRAVRDIEVKEKFVITYDMKTVWKPEDKKIMESFKL